jgi:hypothetical protein
LSCKGNPLILACPPNTFPPADTDALEPEKSFCADETGFQRYSVQAHLRHLPDMMFCYGKNIVGEKNTFTGNVLCFIYR